MRFSIKVNADVVRKGLQNLAAEIPKIGREQIYRVMQHIKTRMSKPGLKPSYPISWDSEKQRKAFFATDGFGRGIPAKRSGAYTSGWRIERRENGYRITNDAGYTKYVGGDAYGRLHSGIHAGRWPVFRDVADEEIERLPDEIEDKIITVARREGF